MSWWWLINNVENFVTLNTHLCRLLLSIYWQELNIHGYQISTVTKQPRLPKTVAVVCVAQGISLSLFAGRTGQVHMIYGLLWVRAVRD